MNHSARAAIAAALALAAAAAAEEKTPGFTPFLLEAPGPVELAIYEDIDGDGLTDVLAVYGREDPREPRRDLAVFFQDRDGFAPQADWLVVLPADVAVIDLGEIVPGSPGRELLLLGGHDLRWLAIPRSAPADRGQERSLATVPGRLAPVAPIYAHAQWNALLHRDLAQPVDQEAQDTLFIPTTEGYRVFFPADGYAAPRDYPADHVHTVAEGTYEVKPADLHLADLDGDGRSDLGFSFLDHLRVYRREGEVFAAEPTLSLDLELLAPMDFEIPEPVDHLVSLTLRDFDGDGRADLFAGKRVVQEKAVVNDKNQYQFYGNTGGGFPFLPDQTFILKNYDQPEILDLDGDGRLDLVTGYFELSLGNIVKALLTRRLGIDLSFFLRGPDGFPYRPQEERTFKIHISLSNLDENFFPAVVIDGDFDGDGRKDFLVQTDDHEVAIYRGTTADGGLYTDDPVRRLKTWATQSCTARDLDGDGRTDLAFDRFPDREPFRRQWINVLLSGPRAEVATP